MRNVNEGEKFYTQEEVEAIALKARLNEAELWDKNMLGLGTVGLAAKEWSGERIAALEKQIAKLPK